MDFPVKVAKCDFICLFFSPFLDEFLGVTEFSFRCPEKGRRKKNWPLKNVKLYSSIFLPSFPYHGWMVVDIKGQPNIDQLFSLCLSRKTESKKSLLLYTVSAGFNESVGTKPIIR